MSSVMEEDCRESWQLQPVYIFFQFPKISPFPSSDFDKVQGWNASDKPYRTTPNRRQNDITYRRVCHSRQRKVVAGYDIDLFCLKMQ